MVKDMPTVPKIDLEEVKRLRKEFKSVNMNAMTLEKLIEALKIGGMTIIKDDEKLGEYLRYLASAASILALLA